MGPTSTDLDDFLRRRAWHLLVPPTPVPAATLPSVTFGPPSTLPPPDVFEPYSGAIARTKAALPPWTLSLPVDFAVTTKDGTSFSLPAGSTLETREDGTQVIGSDNLVVTTQGNTFRLGHSALSLGRSADHFDIGQADFRLGDVRATLNDVVADIERDKDTAKLSFRSADIKRDDLTVTLGENTLLLSREPDGGLRLVSDGLNGRASWKGGSLALYSDHADAALTADGRLLVNHLSGTHVDFDSKEYSVRLDIARLDDMFVQVAGANGPAQGAKLSLIPNGPDARLSLRATATYKGLPVTLEINDAGSLDARLALTPGTAHLLIADATGRGDIRLSSGPIAVRGSKIEVTTQTLEYDAGRMQRACDRLLSRGGLTLGPVTVEPTNVLRLATPFAGPHLEASLLLDRELAATLAAGWSFGGTVAEAFVGALPGGFIDVNVVQGQLSFAGVPLPNRFGVPTTLVAGLAVRHQGQRRWSLAAGASEHGAFATVSLSSGRASLNATTVAGPDGMSAGFFVGVNL